MQEMTWTDMVARLRFGADRSQEILQEISTVQSVYNVTVGVKYCTAFAIQTRVYQ